MKYHSTNPSAEAPDSATGSALISCACIIWLRRIAGLWLGTVSLLVVCALLAASTGTLLDQSTQRERGLCTWPDDFARYPAFPVERVVGVVRPNPRNF